MENRFKRVLLIGFDGMDFHLTSKLISVGKLPNFKKLALSGAFTKLNTSLPPHSPVAWTTISTGVNPGKHGIFDFFMRKPDLCIPELSLFEQNNLTGEYSSKVKSKTFFEILSESGIDSTVLHWPMSFPPKDNIGKVLPGLGTPDINGLLSSPVFYGESVTNEDSKNIKVDFISKSAKIPISMNFFSKSGTTKILKSNIEISSNNLEKLRIVSCGKTNFVDVGKWSDWIEVEFKSSLFTKVSAILKFFVKNIRPLEIQASSLQINPLKPCIKISSPENFCSQLAGKIGLFYTLGMPEETEPVISEKITKEGFLEQVYSIEEEREAMFWQEFPEFIKKDRGVLSILFDSSDRLQHIFFNQTDLSRGPDFKVTSEIEKFWIKKDEFIGKVLEKIDNSTLLLIVSDHGFSSFRKAVTLNSWLLQNGFLSVTSRNWNSFLFTNVDWKTTRAYSLGFNSIYLNLEGRESQGIVKPFNKEKIENEIIEKLKMLKDIDGNPVIRDVYKSSKHYFGQASSFAPDLIIGFNPGFRASWQNALGGFTSDAIYDNDKWQADHLVDPEFVPGVLFSNSKLKQGISKVNQVDITPTILSVFNMLDSNMDGSSIL